MEAIETQRTEEIEAFLAKTFNDEGAIDLLDMAQMIPQSFVGGLELSKPLSDGVQAFLVVPLCIVKSGAAWLFFIGGRRLNEKFAAHEFRFA